MSANIYYKQVKPKDRQGINTTAPSSFIAAMERAFGFAPWRLTAEHIPILTGMMAVVPFEHDEYNGPYEQLIDAIHQLEMIEAWAEG